MGECRINVNEHVQIQHTQMPDANPDTRLLRTLPNRCSTDKTLNCEAYINLVCWIPVFQLGSFYYL